MSRALKGVRRRFQQHRHATQGEEGEWFAPAMLRREQNKRLYRGDLRPLLDLPDITETVFQDIRDRLEKNGFVKFLVVGDNNSGKSVIVWLLGSFTAIVSRGKPFTVEFPELVPRRIKHLVGQPMRGALIPTSDTSETLSAIKTMALPGDFVGQDEDLDLEGGDSQLVLARANSLFKAGRAYQVSLGVSTTKMHKNLVHFDFKIHTWRINFRRRITRCFVRGGSSNELMGWAHFRVPELGGSYREIYRKKWDTLGLMIDDQGSRTVARVLRIDEARTIADYVKGLARKHGVTVSSYKVFRVLARTKRIAGGSQEQDDLITLSYQLYKAVTDLEGAFGTKPGAPQRPIATADDDFLTVFRNVARVLLRPLVKKPIVVERWILRYVDGLTYTAIKERLEERERSDSIGDSIRAFQEKISNTLKGDILEEATTAFLNAHTMFSPEGTPPHQAPPTSSTDLTLARWLRGTWRPPGSAETCDTAVASSHTRIHAAVNCKLVFEHRPSWAMKCHPEDGLHSQEPPGKPYMLLLQLAPGEQPILSVHPVPKGGRTDTSVEEVKWKRWLKELREIVRGVGGG